MLDITEKKVIKQRSQNMHSNKKKVILWLFSVGALATLVFIIVSSGVIREDGDDLMFKMKSTGISSFEFLKMRYETWTGRIPTEFTLISFLKLPIFYWHLLVTVIISLFAWSVSSIFVKLFNQNKYSYLHLIYYFISICIPGIVWMFSDTVCLAHPKDLDLACSVTSSGMFWYSGFFTYFFPITILLVVVALFLKLDEFKGYSKIIMTSLTIILSIFVTSIEQTAIFFALFCIVNSMHYFIKHQFTRQSLKSYIISSNFVVYAFACIQSIVFLFAPGNKARLAQEIIDWLPAYRDYTIIDKLVVGTKTMYAYFIIHMLWLTIFLFCALLLYAFLRKKAKCTSISLLGIVLTIFLVLIVNDKKITAIHYLYDSNIVPAVNTIWSIPEVLLFVVIMGLLLYLLFCLLKGYQRIFIIFMFCNVFITTILLGFSPTVYASGVRTQYFAYILFTIIFIFILLSSANFHLNEFKQRIKKGV